MIPEDWDAVSVRGEFESAVQAGYTGRYILDVLSTDTINPTEREAGPPELQHERTARAGVATGAVHRWAEISGIDLRYLESAERFLYLDQGEVRPMAVRQGQAES